MTKLHVDNRLLSTVTEDVIVAYQLAALVVKLVA